MRFAAVSLTLAATLVPWSTAEAQTSTNLTIDRDAQLLNSNQILITGTVPYRVGAMVSLSVEVSQNAGGQNGVIGGSGFPIPFACNTAGPQLYSIVAMTFDGSTFHNGKAHVTADARICDPPFGGCGEQGTCTEEFNAVDVHVSK